MKPTTLITLFLTTLTTTTTTTAAAASTAQKATAASLHLDNLLALAYTALDLEGICAQQACEALHPDAPGLCTQDMVDGYRVQCGDVLAQTGIAKKTKGGGKKEEEEEKLAAEAEAQMQKAVKRAPEVVTPDMVEIFMDEEREGFGVEEMHRLVAEMGGMSCED